MKGFRESAHQAKKAAIIPKAPPVLIRAEFGAPLEFSRYPMPRNRKAMSRVKKSEKKATVERSVQRSRIKVKMNQPMR